MPPCSVRPASPSSVSPPWRHAAKVKSSGRPAHLAAAPLICFEWHHRPENVLAGHLKWPDYRPAERPNTVQLFHHKTKVWVSLPLIDSEGPLFPELTAYLDGLERLGVPVVLMKPKAPGGPAKPFLLRTARNRVRAAARAAVRPRRSALCAAHMPRCVMPLASCRCHG